MSSRPVAEGRSRSAGPGRRARAGGWLQPPTRRTSGDPMRRNTTSAERGLPGSPTIGTPPQSASSVGLPGLIARPWQKIPGSPRRPTAVGGLVACADRRAGRDHDHVTAGHRGARGPSRVPPGSSGTMPPRTGSPPASVTSAAMAAWKRRVPGPGAASAVREARLRRRSRRSQPSGAHTPPRRSPRPRRAFRGRGPEGRSAARARPRQRVLVGPHDALAGRDRPVDLDRAGHRLGVYSIMTTASAPAGSMPPVGHAHRRPRADRHVGCGAHLHGPEHLEVAGQAVGDPVGVGRPHGEAVDRRAGEPR